MEPRGTMDPTNGSTDFPCQWMLHHRQEDALSKTPGLAGIVTPPHPMSVCRVLRGAG